jgi:cytochrome c553
MKLMAPVITMGLLLTGTACHDLERSRAVDNPAVSGKTIAQQICSNCHGVTGVSVSPTFPKLAGQQREYLVNQLTDLKTRTRSDPHARTFMWGFTHLTDAQINEIATYFSSQPAVMGKASDRALMDQGRAIFWLFQKWSGVCQEREHQSTDVCGALPKMKEGPSESACRSRLQTATSCVGKEPSW